MKKIFKLATVAVLSLSLIAGCGTASTSSSSEVIKIGGLFELTGGAAQYGTAGMRGAKLAIDQQNAKGGVLGKQIKLIEADNKSVPDESVLQATKLVTQDKVVGLLGPMTTKTIQAIIPIVSQNKVPLVTPSGTGAALTVENGKLNQWIFRACFMDEFQGEVGARFALDTLKVKNVAMVIDNSGDYAKGLGKSFEKVFTEGGGKIVATENYVAGDLDFKAVLGLIKSKSPEAIYVPGYYNEVGLIVKQARELGITVPIFGGDGFNGNETTKIAGESNMTKIYYSDHVATDDPNLVEFIKQYKEKYNEEPTGFAALGYDSAMMMIKAIETAGTADGEKIRVALEGIKDLKGVTGNISVDAATHNPSKSAVILEYKEGKWVFTSRVDPK